MRLIGLLAGCAPEPEPLAAEADLEALTLEVAELLARVEQLEAQNADLQADLAESRADQADLQIRVEAAEAQLEAMGEGAATLDALRAVLSVDADGDLVVEGANLRIRNGAGSSTGLQNGKGNLILGYDEQLTGTEGRTGSHNLVIGPGHAYDGEAGLLVGTAHRQKAGAVGQVGLGGRSASLEGDGAVAVGGEGAQVRASGVTVGGYSAYVDGAYSVVIGGWDNGTEAYASVVTGGRENYGIGTYGTILGGQYNTDGSETTTVVGGYANSAVAPWALALGGQSNQSASEYGVSLP